MENEDISLWPYVAAILGRWPLILATALIGAIVGITISAVTPKKYQATAAVVVLIRQTGSQAGANQPFLSVETIDVGSRRQGLLALAESNVIEAQISPDIISQIAPAKYKPGKLIKFIDATLDGDLLTIDARASSAEQAKLLADTWASTFVSYAQPLFADRHTELRLAGEAIAPFEPYSPNTIQNTLLGVLSGLTLGVLLALVVNITGFSLPAGLRRPQRKSSAQSPSPTR